MYAGLAIYDTMQFIKPDVQTICVGIAMSMGALLLAGGAEGKRMALPNAKILIHQVSSGFQGQATDIEIHAREIIDLRRRLDEIIAKHTSRTSTRSSSDTERDYFMTSEEAASTESSTGSSPSTSGAWVDEELDRWHARPTQTSSSSAASAASRSGRSRS